MFKICCSILLLLLCISASGQSLEEVNIDYMLRGQVYVCSSIEDKDAPGGFGGSGNRARKINGQSGLSNNGFFLQIDTTEDVAIGQKYKGYRLYIANRSDSIVKLRASDSRLSAVIEVFVKGQWQPIEYLPGSWCGNSYHTVYLKQQEYWQCAVPRFTGKIPVKLRYSLRLNNGQYLYSNEITAHINKGQLSNKKDYTPNGLMDPYVD
jgi:hypothetical protein